MSPAICECRVFKESKRISRRPCNSGGGVCKGNREVVLTYRVDVLKRNYFRVCVLDILILPPPYHCQRRSSLLAASSLSTRCSLTCRLLKKRKWRMKSQKVRGVVAVEKFSWGNEKSAHRSHLSFELRRHVCRECGSHTRPVWVQCYVYVSCNNPPPPHAMFRNHFLRTGQSVG